MKLTTSVDQLSKEIRAVGEELTVQKNNAIRTAVYLGAMLNELKLQVSHGDFIPLRRKLLPAHSDDTCERYMSAAQNVVKLSGVTIDISPAKLLSAPDAELTEEHLEARQTVFDFMADKSIKECISGVVLDGDEPHRITRAANGKNARQTKGDDRKDFPLFGLEKLSDLSAHLSHWKTMPETHRNDLGQIIKAAILGDAMKLAGRKKAMVHFKPWPEEFSKIALDALRERLKGK